MPQKHKTRPYSKVLAHLHKHNNENIIGHVSIHTQANFHVFEYTFSAGGPGLSFHTPFAVIITHAVSPLEIWKGYTPFKVNIWIGAPPKARTARIYWEENIVYLRSRTAISFRGELKPKPSFVPCKARTESLLWGEGWVYNEFGMAFCVSWFGIGAYGAIRFLDVFFGCAWLFDVVLGMCANML